jgi:predicted nuclease with TOPRIM domain
VLTDTVARENTASEKAGLFRKYTDLLAVNCRLLKSETKLQDMLNITRIELRTVREENDRLRTKVKTFEGTQGLALKSRIEKAALSSKLSDAQNLNTALFGDFQSVQQRSDHMNRHCVELEAKLVKMKDQTATFSTRSGSVDDEAMNLQRFGLLLADALGEKFDSRSGDPELRRLILIAKELRIAFVENPPIGI